MRPDYFGSWMAWKGHRFTEVAYFKSAEAAQQGEKRIARSEHATDFDRWLNGITDVRYIDIEEPWHYE